MKDKTKEIGSVYEAVKATVGTSLMSRSGIKVRLEGLFTEAEIDKAIDKMPQVRIRIRN